MSSERESCNSRHFTWLMKSCFPNPNDTNTHTTTAVTKPQPHVITPAPTTTISSLPDDIILDFLTRVPPSSLPSLSLVCRRWSRLLHSPDFSDLRRTRHLLRHAALALAVTDFGLSSATLLDGAWNPSLFLPCYHDAASLNNFHSLLSHARLASIGPRIYIVGRDNTLRYDTWTATVTPRSTMIFPRKKFALAAVSGKLYVAGGGSRISAVEEYDPETNTWRVVSNAPRRRYGCIGASADGIFYVIGGLRIGASVNELSRASGGTEAHAAYASSMDLFDVEACVWLRSRAVPGGGCVVAACAAAGRVYMLTSHAVELSFWSFDARRKCGSGGDSGRGGGAFGEWCRIKSPPLRAQVRVDTRMRFSCVGIGEKVVLIQLAGCVNEGRGSREGAVLVYDCVTGEWSRGADLPEVYRRAAYVGVEC